jgi:hypothetical protein
MTRFLRSCFLLTVAFAASMAHLQAQTVIYGTDFPDDQGWVFQAPPSSVAWWAVDATPGTVLGSPAWHSAPFSLNFNNGTCYCGGGTNLANGTATSPTIDLGDANGSIDLQFWCNWDTEETPPPYCGFDQRLLTILDGAAVVSEQCFNEELCGTLGQWHLHSIPLDPAWGLVRLRFSFVTIDWMFNEGAGWFIDDLAVIGDCAATQGYCTPKLNSLGCSPTIFTTGIASLSGNGTAFRIWAGGVLNQKVGLMLWSRTPASTPFGGGTLCVAAPITRTTAQNSGGTALPASDCTGTYVFQFTSAMMSQAGLLVNDDVYAQYWSRDNGFAPPDNVGLTAGVHWEVCP